MSDYSASSVPKIGSVAGRTPSTPAEGLQTPAAASRLNQANAVAASSSTASSSTSSSSSASGSAASSSTASSATNTSATASVSTTPATTYDSAYLQAPAQSASVAVKFVEDPQTKAVTVYVIDRATHNVVRTIPQNEMNNMQPGALLEIGA
ncbi:MAG: flagellar protein FlaG [Anaerolineaceae bacterium]|nr:flagellar protein FlaG [Anaerolineaceae bacterium]